MPINKITPRSLDKSTDQRLVPATAFIDAVNAVIEDSGLNGDGNDGVIKNANSNEQVVTHTALDAIGTTEDDVKIIGSVVDHKLKLVYLFVKNSNPQENGVWVYDPYGKLSLPTKYAWEFLENESGDQGAYQDGFDGYDAYAKNTLKCVAKGAYFDFDEHSVVQGNVVYGNTLTVPKGLESLTVTSAERNTFEKDFHLYFTDNRTEPKKINVIGSMFSRAISLKMGDENPYGIFDSLEGGKFKLPDGKNEEILFSYACRPTPLKRPTFKFESDTSSRANNFEKSAGFQFAYQVVYNDGSESSISPKSEIAHLPSILYQGKNKNVDHAQYNSCKIDIEDDFITFSDGRANYIKKIKVLAQEGSAPYNIVEEIDSPSFPISFNFKNDVIGIIVSSKEEDKFFDSVPQKAEAQTVVDNRLMYGNYVEGFENSNVQATLTVEYNERKPENFGQVLDLKNSIILERHPGSNNNGLVKQKMAGVRLFIEDGDFPSMDEGDVVTMTIGFLPNRNFHIYNAINSFHQSRHWGVSSNDDENDNFQTPDSAGVKNLMPFSEGTWSYSNATSANLDSGQPPEILNAFINNGGVAKTTWTTVDSFYPIAGTDEISFGTSAANPLILPASAITFSISLKCNVSGYDPNELRTHFFEITDRVLASAGSPLYDASSNEVFSVESIDNYSTISWDLPITNLQRVEEGNYLAKLINMGAKRVFGDLQRCGATTILKKGSAKFGLRKANTSSESSPDIQNLPASKVREYKIVLDSIPIDGLEMWTCVKKWMPDSPWWMLSPEYLTQALNQEVSLSDFYSDTGYTLSEYASDWSSAEDFQLPSGATRNVFEQKNDISDFNHPGGRSQSGLGVFDIEIINNNSDWRTMAAALKSSVGFASSINTVSGLIAGDEYFVCCPCPEESRQPGTALLPGFGEINDAYAKFYSVMDGEGGPGGQLPPDTLPDSYEFPDYSARLPDFPNGMNPAYVGINYGSSAYGNSYREINGQSYQNKRAPGFFGPYFTGKITSNAAKVSLQVASPPVGAHYYSTPGGAAHNQGGQGARTTIPLIQGPQAGLFLNYGSHVAPLNSIYSARYDQFIAPGQDEVENPWHEWQEMTMSFLLRNPFIDRYTQTTLDVSTSLDNSDSVSLRSFKTNSDHNFGVVFYDEVGRRSFVNDIGSVYVAGFSDQERGANKGEARIKVNLNGVPPEYAKKYQIVYGGNKTITDFVQYTANNAFIEPTNLTSEDLNVDINNGKIYVSLNLLQDSSISYAKEFGARGKDGGLSIYKFSNGDKLRIISYGKDSDRQYPNNAVFDVIEVVHLDPISGVESNPLTGANANPGSELFGDFVVIQNNESEAASGFSYSDLISGGDAWDQNVVFEIFSPKKTTGVETQVYREIGGVYDVEVLEDGSSAYSTANITAYEGDIYFRQVACNVNRNENNGWVDIMAVDNDATDNSTDLKSNFANIFLETTTASDLFPSEIQNCGRVNVSTSNAKTVRREAGIIYSEKSNPDSDRLNYSSFNASLFPYKDLEERFGNINFMDEVGGNLFVIQQDRCTKIPVSATMLTNASGQEQLIASNEILGKEAVASVKAGCDNNPESVVRVDNTFYFAHKSTGKVFRFVDGQGIEEISDVNMASYFREIFDEAIAMSQRPDLSDVRVVGGYEPIKQEYLLTILTPEE